ncbi:mitochondrial import inner membrane translocase subunit Tim29-like [Acipenser oxyrinchus oxyrinchus]|uniref:Mitochondrial import inner membrane translocase subunit Tim29-like n=1 Tax=Acipenser oxyrinchus oxyrinchus TaxID=40147 RepID=A0AAD8CVQ9_ACIOX|nr:mitochondrial import inner membrane translocase subunit Tim29-like [Acipenser oxyrinchus oxyrinchus]
MAAARVCRRWCSTAARAAGDAGVTGAARAGAESQQVTAGKGSRWERLRDGRMGLWWKGLLRDYKEACRDVFAGARERPGKAALYLSLLGGAGAFCHWNPSEASFESSLLEASNTLLLLSPWIRSGDSDGHVQGLTKLRNQGRLRYQSLGLLSLVYEAPFHPDSSLYEARCQSLRPRWLHFPSRVLDLGFCRRWWILERKMRDFDINEQEFMNLPPHLSTISPKQLLSQENERLYEEKYRPVSLSEEEIARAESEESAIPPPSTRGSNPDMQAAPPLV